MEGGSAPGIKDELHGMGLHMVVSKQDNYRRCTKLASLTVVMETVTRPLTCNRISCEPAANNPLW